MIAGEAEDSVVKACKYDCILKCIHVCVLVRMWPLIFGYYTVTNSSV